MSISQKRLTLWNSTKIFKSSIKKMLRASTCWKKTHDKPYTMPITISLVSFAFLTSQTDISNFFKWFSFKYFLKSRREGCESLIHISQVVFGSFGTELCPPRKSTQETWRLNEKIVVSGHYGVPKCMTNNEKTSRPLCTSFYALHGSSDYWWMEGVDRSDSARARTTFGHLKFWRCWSTSWDVLIMLWLDSYS